MQRRFLTAIAIVLAVCGLTACQPETSAYRHIKGLPYEQWNAYALSLPLEQRLDLQKEILQHSGHNPKMIIDEAFIPAPAQTYQAIVRRLRQGEGIRYYLGVLYEIDRQSGFRICAQPDRKVVQDKLREYWSDLPPSPNEPDFYKC